MNKNSFIVFAALFFTSSAFGAQAPDDHPDFQEPIFLNDSPARPAAPKSKVTKNSDRKACKKSSAKSLFTNFDKKTNPILRELLNKSQGD